MRRITTLLLAFALALTLALPASAGGGLRPANGSTAFTVVPTCEFPPAPGGLDDCALEGETLIFTLANPGVLTGTLAGTQLFVATIRFEPDGTFTFSGYAEVNGSLAGCGSGSMLFDAFGHGYLNEDGDVVFQRNELIAVDGGSLRMKAHIRSLGPAPTDANGAGVLDYEGWYRC